MDTIDAEDQLTNNNDSGQKSYSLWLRKQLARQLHALPRGAMKYHNFFL